MIGRDFVGDDPSALILGDNIYYGHGLSQTAAARQRSSEAGATVFGYYVTIPSATA